jgi:hypothetical protein
MRSPIKNHKFKNLCVSELKKIIVTDSIVDSFGLFCGRVELALANSGTSVKAHTDKEIIYQFWRCLTQDKKRLCSMIEGSYSEFVNEMQHKSLQENLTNFKDSYIRSSIFYILNHRSATGQVSCGQYIVPSISDEKRSLYTLKTFKAPKRFQVLYYTSDKPPAATGDYRLFLNLNFSYNLTDIGKHSSYDTYNFNHKRIRNLLDNASKKTIAVYNSHPGVYKFFKNNHMIMVDKYGNRTTNKDESEEIIVTNF